MRIIRLVVWMLSTGMVVLDAGVVCSQDYPNKPIRIVTASAGGSFDFTSRLISQGLSGPLGQQVIVENRAGGTNVLGEVISRAPPDGYTLIVAGGSLYIVTLLRKMPYDPMSDFSPITMTTRAPLLVVVHPSLPVKSIKELIALAKARPGALNFSTGGTAGSAHLAAELFKAMAGVNMVRIPYSSGSMEITDLVGGRVHLSFGNGKEVMPHVKSGKLRALAVTSLQPSALYPGVPTVAESGVPGYQAGSFDGMFAPSKTPATIIQRLNQEVVRVLSHPDVKQKFLDSGVEAVSSSPEEFAAWLKSDMSRLGKVIKDAGIQAD